MANPIVIDISHWQPDPIDWDKVKAGGTVGVIHKATQGASHVDEDLFHRAKAAMEEGLCWSTYHYIDASASMQAQMAHYLETVQPRPGERMCLDHEDRGVSLAQLKDCVQLLLSQRPDLQITIYSGFLIKEQLSGYNAFLAENTSLWLAHYTTGTPTWPQETWPQWSLWQYTDKGSCAGIGGNIDANKWNGDPANLPAWFGPAGEESPPAPEPDFAMVELAVKLPADVGLTLTINGGETHTWTPKLD